MTDQPQEAPKPEPAEDQISYDYFSKLNIRIAEVKSAERVEGADKLLKLDVDLGDEVRQIVAGIAQQYDPDRLSAARSCCSPTWNQPKSAA